MAKLKRSDSQYTDIENFKLYELTHNICYEMAIRNDEVIALVKSYLDSWLIDSKSNSIFTSSDLVQSKESCNKLSRLLIDPSNLYIHYHFFKEEKEMMDKIIKEEDREDTQKKLEREEDKEFTELHTKLDMADKKGEEVSKDLCIKYNEYVHRRNQRLQAKILEEEPNEKKIIFYELCKEINTLNKEQKEIPKNLLNKYSEYVDRYRKALPNPHIFGSSKGTLFIHEITNYTFDSKDTDFKSSKFSDNEQIIFTEIKTNLFGAIKTYKNINNGECESIIRDDLSPVYSRPTLVNFYESKEVGIRLNLAMPTRELTDFIERLKEDYDKNYKSIISISELLGKELIPFRDIIFNQKNKIILDRKTKKQMRATSFTSNGFKMADILFIYDCLVLKYSNQKIKYLLTEYYETQNKIDTIDDEKYRRYVAIGKDFIDNKRYKELYLGSSI